MSELLDRLGILRIRWSVARVVGLVVGLVWLVGLVGFVATPAVFEVELPRRRAQEPAGEHNLAALELGPRIRASSYWADWAAQHHPAFLVDGREHPGLVEKWTSERGDQAPWVEILWREAHDLARVVIHHAGVVEDPGLTSRRYRVACLRGGEPGPAVSVNGNEQPRATHLLACPQARGVRVEFEPNEDGDRLTRVYEIEAWGR